MRRIFWSTKIGERALYQVLSDEGRRSHNWTFERRKSTIINESSGGPVDRTDMTWQADGTIVHNRAGNARVGGAKFVDFLDSVFMPTTGGRVLKLFWVKENNMREQYRLVSRGALKVGYDFEKNVGNTIGDADQDTGRTGSEDLWRNIATVLYTDGSTKVEAFIASNLLDAIYFG